MKLFGVLIIFLLAMSVSRLAVYAQSEGALRAVVVVGDLDNPDASRAELDLRDSLDSAIQEGKFQDCPEAIVVYSGYNFANPRDAKWLKELGVSRSGLPRLMSVEIRNGKPTKVLWSREVTNLRDDIQSLLKSLGLAAVLDDRYERPQVSAANGYLTFRVPPGFKAIKTRGGLPFLGKEPPHTILGMQRGWPLVAITYSKLALLPSEVRNVQFLLTKELASNLNIESSEITVYNGTQWLRLVVTSSEEIQFETLVTSIQGKAVIVTFYKNFRVEDSSVGQLKAIRESLVVAKPD